jgi:hypothetical protein
MRGGLLIIIVVAIVTFVVDAMGNKCIQRNGEVATLIFTHHIIYTFALLGWLLDDFALLLVYVFVPLIAMLHWNTAPSCIIDEVSGKLCGEQREFMHLGRQLNLPHKLICALIGVGVLIGIYKLYRILRDRPRGPPPSLVPCFWRRRPAGCDGGCPSARAVATA